MFGFKNIKIQPIMINLKWAGICTLRIIILDLNSLSWRYYGLTRGGNKKTWILRSYGRKVGYWILRTYDRQVGYWILRTYGRKGGYWILRTYDRQVGYWVLRSYGRKI